MSRLFCTIVVIVCIIQAAVLSLPLLSIDGFSWAENLVFDGNGSLFVSDYVKGEIKRIYLCSRASSNSNSDSPVDGDYSSRFGNSDDNYCVDIYASTGLKSVSGLVVSSDGRALYAGVILASNSAVAAAANSENGADEFALIRMPTDPALANGGYEIVLKTKLKPNGLAADWSTNTIYYTEEGSGTDDTGTLSAIHLPVEKEGRNFRYLFWH